MSADAPTQAKFDEAMRAIGARRRPVAPPRPDPDYLTASDVGKLLPQYFAARLSLPIRRDRRHPLLTESIGWSVSNFRTRSSMTGSDFSQVMESALSELLVSKFSEVDQGVSKVARNIDLENFLSHTFPTLSIGEPGEVVEDSDPAKLSATVSESQKGQLRSYAAKIGFNRAIWSTFGGKLAGQILDFAGVFAGIENRLLAQTLEAATLTTASGALSVDGLDTAAKALRTQLNGAGQKCNLPIFSLLLPLALEVTGRKLRADLGWPQLNLVINSELSSGTVWYAFCDPSISSPLL